MAAGEGTSDPVRARPPEETAVGSGSAVGLVAPSPSRRDPPGAAPLVQLDDVHVVFSTRKGLFRGGEVRALNGVSLS
ncbi:MAG: microcin ABC transporter ATP-binding protein, partial [Chloroflexota bacterium]|nr:microcin ABC transporter ATP-binding protein [Chloroflexota bacterium]